MRHLHCVVLASALLSASCAALAGPAAIAPLPGEVVERITARHKHVPDPMPQALSQKLGEVDKLLGVMEQEEKAKRQAKAKGKSIAPQTALQVDHAPAIAAYQAELESLRTQALTRIESERVRQPDAAAQAALAALEDKVRNRFAQVATTLNDVRAATSADRAAAVTRAQGVLGKLRPARQDAIPFVPTWSAGKPPAMLPQKKALDYPQYLATPYAPGDNVYAFAGNTLLAALPPSTPAEAASCTYAQADLDPTPDVVIDQEIKDLAEKLEYSPAKILKWMHDNIRFEPYYGSLKGAKGTLVAKAGGPTDQASLMIALLRASNIPARYVKGKVDFLDPVNPGANARAMRWLGAKSAQGAAAKLSQGLFPEVVYFGDNSGVRFVHVWVEACVPYAHYRGAKIDNAGHRWLPLDPSIKDHTYRADVDVAASMNYTNYLAQRRNGPNSLPHEYFAENHVKPALPAGKTLEDLGYTPSLRPMKLDILPATLPYTVTEFRQWGGGITSPETAVLPDTHRYKLAATVQNGAAATLINAYSMSLPEIALKRLTLRYKGAEALAQTGAITCSGIQGRPALLLEGVELTQGSATVDACTTDNKLILTLSHGEVTGGTVNTVTFGGIKAADYHALQAYAFQASDRLLEERAKKLIDSVRANTDPDANLEETEGEYLHLVGLKYMRHITDAGKRVGALTNGSGESGNHIGLTAARTKVDYLFDLPFAVTRDGFLVDVPGGRSRDVDLASGAIRWEPFLLNGYTSSAYESDIWQENARMDAVSTVRGLQFARETGISVLSVNSANWATESPKFTSNADANYNYSTAQVNSIKTNYIDQGYTLTIPRQLIQYETWKGYIFTAEKNNLPTSASASYGISGGYAGGYTVPISGFALNPILDTGYIFGSTVPSIMFPQAGLPPLAVGGGLVGWGNVTGITSWGGDPVNLVTGNFYHVERDLSIPGRGGLPLVFERSYNNRGAKDGPLGFGWTHSFHHRLKFYGVESSVAKVSWIDGTGNEKFFSTASHAGGNVNTGAILTNPAGAYVKFERLSNGQYKLTEKNGLAYTFESATGPASPPAAGSEPQARLLEIRDRNGNALTLSYAGNGRAGCASGANLAKVTDGVGRELHLCYDGANRIVSLFDWTNREYRYAYDAAGDLISFKNPLAVTDPAKQPPVAYQYYSAAEGANLAHAMKQYTLPRGNGMKFEYYANGRVFRHYTLPNFETTTFRYNDFRRETAVTNERGQTRSHFFDEWGNPLAIVEENNATHAYTYDAANPYNRLSKQDPLGLSTQYQYDVAGNVTQITQPSTATVQFFDFNGFNQPQRIKDARGNWTLMAYDTRGNLTDEVRLKAGAIPTAGVSPAAGQVVSWVQRAFDSYGNPTGSKRLRDFSGATLANYNSGAGPSLTTAFDASSLYPVSVTRSGDKDGDGVIGAGEFDTANLIHDSLGRPLLSIDNAWHSVTAQYDTVDRVIRATDATGRLRDARYDANGNRILEQLIVNGAQVDSRAWGFDLSDRNELVLDAGGHAVRTEFDAGGNPLTITDPDGYRLTFDYDAASRWVRAYDKAGHAVTRDLDLEGKPRTVTDPNGNSKTFAYWDATQDGRLKRETGATGRYVEYSYDANGNVLTLTDHLSRTTRTHYDELNRPVRSVGPLDGAAYPVTCMKYDNLSRVTELWAGSTTDQNAASCDLTGSDPNLKKQASYQYDDFNRKLRETDVLNRQQAWTYDVNSNVTQYTDAKNQTSQFTWDYGHQLLTQTVKNSGNATYRSYSYIRNSLGQVSRTEIKDGANALILAYDYAFDAHRLTQVTDSRGNKKLNYAYSPGGLLNLMQDSDGHRTDYLYDAVGRLTGVWAPNYDYVAFAHDAGGRITEKWFPNGLTARYAYNADDTLANLTNALNGSPLTSHVYTYDTAGRRQTQAETIAGVLKSWTYAYDNLDRLISANEGTNSESYAYDYLNNRKTKTTNGATLAYLYDQANQLTEIRSGSDTGAILASLAYDNNGDLTAKTGASPLTLTWDPEGKLQAANNESYLYDDQGRRIKKTVAGTTTNYLYNGPDIHAETNSANAIQAVYAHGPNWDDPLIRLTGSTNQPAANAAYYHQDGLNSSVATTDSLGTTTGTQRFDAWGNKVASAGSVAQYGYTGREPDATGLMFYRARYYDPSFGRFISRDPAGMPDGVNRYGYVSNDPVNLTDPSGECPWCIGAVSSVVLGGVIRGLTGGDIFDAKAIATDAALGAVGAGFANKVNQLARLKDVPASLGTKLFKTSSGASNPINEGVYLARTSTGQYVGQSQQIATRLSRHVSNSKLTVGQTDDAVRLAVGGGKTSREVAEQRVLTKMGGPDAPDVLNKINPVGGRMGLVNNPSLGVIDRITIPNIGAGTSAAIGSGIGFGNQTLNGFANADSFAPYSGGVFTGINVRSAK